MYTDGHHKLSTNTLSDVDFEMHVLKTNTSNSTNSTGLSPIPHATIFSQISQTTQAESATTSPWQPSDDIPKRKKPPPVKPKPSSSKKKTTLPSKPCPPSPVVVTSSSHHAALCRSYSEEAIHVKWPAAKERPNNINLPRLRQSHVSTGSLPDFFTPSLDEDDYTIPNPHRHLLPYHLEVPSSRLHQRPQPYLLPRQIYSYAYIHVPSTHQVCQTIPREYSGQRVNDQPKSRSLSDKTNDHTHRISSDNDEIFVDKYWKEQAMVGQAATNHTPLLTKTVNHTHSSTSHAPLKTRPFAQKLRSIHSSPITTSHTPSETNHTPLSCISERMMSNASDEGYMNSDEYPRPVITTSHLPHYTPLHPTHRDTCPTYDFPRGDTNISDICDYDHIV